MFIYILGAKESTI